MKFNWGNRKQVFSTKLIEESGLTHSQVPYYLRHKEKEFIFYTSRPPQLEDGSYVSQICKAEVKYDEQEGFSVLKPYSHKLIELGTKGCFDESGTMPCSVVNREDLNEIWMYYVGWNRKFSVPYDCAIGLAISKDGGETFVKYSSGPVLGQNVNDPFLVGCPRVYYLENKWMLFYLSGVQWVTYGDKKEAHYKIKMAVSEDGLSWRTNNNYLIPERYEMESQTCPSVFFHEGYYHMYFTYRHTVDFRNPERGYRIGYAYSKDLLHWERDDAAGNFDIGTEDFDNEMVCYPNVNKIGEDLVMLYCGNKFGRLGFNSAVLEK